VLEIKKKEAIFSNQANKQLGSINGILKNAKKIIIFSSMVGKTISYYS